MTLPWTTPNTFVAGKTLTAAQLNAMNTNINFLYTRPQRLSTIRGTGTNLTTLATAFADVDALGTLSLTLETSGGALEFNLLGTVSNTVLNALTCFDIYMDGTTYMSSVTATPIANGIWQQRTTVAASIDSIKATPYRVEVGAVAAGIHTFVLRWRVSAGTSTLYVAAGNLVQFYARESA